MDGVAIGSDVTVKPKTLRTHTLTVSVCVLSAGHSPYLSSVMAAILRAKPRPDKVRLIWSGRGPRPDGLPLGIEFESIEASSFNHGSTRQLALERCTTDLIAFVSDDAEPLDDQWLLALIRPFEDPFVAAVYGRQLARGGATIDERVFRELKYPSGSFSIALCDVEAEQGLTIPVSNANGAYNADSLRAVGGFPSPCEYGEDRIVAVSLLRAGMKVAYAGDAVVLHSHDLSLRELFGRGVRSGRLPSQTGRSEGTARVGKVILGGARSSRRMAIEAWRQGGIGGFTAVLRRVLVSGAGYIVGRVLATIGPLPNQTTAIRSTHDLPAI